MFILIALSLIVSLLSGFWTKEEKTELATPVYQVPDPSPNPQFVSPMHIPLSLAANFCEVRKDHYHMGLDVRTEQRENLPVYSVEDGYVSRVAVSPTGYGNAIYIDHINGYTSVYAHLNDFYPALQEYVIKKQHEQEKSKIDVHLRPGEFPVKKDQFIAFSGNTGSSAGPHLHFEIRETKTEKGVNPFSVGFSVEDNIAPVVYGLYYYDRTTSTYEQLPKALPYKSQKVLKVSSPRVSFAARTEDRNNSSGYLMGIYGAEVLLDDAPVFSMAMERFPFNDTRYVNAGIDYKKWAIDGSKIQHLSRLPGNRGQFFEALVNDGIIDLSDGEVHNVKVVISDHAGNKTMIEMNLQYNGVQATKKATFGNVVVPNKGVTVTSAHAAIELTEASAYDTLFLTMNERSSATKGSASPIITIGSKLFPLHDSVIVRIKPNRPAEENKLVLVVHGSHNYFSVQKPRKQGDYFGARYNKYGEAELIEDVLPPTISGFKEGQRVYNLIKVTVNDNLKTIEELRGEIDGKWVMFKRSGNSYSYAVDERCPPGPHVLNLKAIDVAGNITEKQYNFTRSTTPVPPQIKKKAGKKRSNAKNRR